ncbi:MAG: glycosyltransferase family 4 protein, partial [Acidimicrobiales bacterium]
HRVGARVVHHAGGIVPLRHPGRIVLTLHDLQPLDLPANFTPAKRSYIRAMAKRSVRAADVVCVPSAFTRDRAVELLGAPAEKFVVVPWSVASRPPATPEPSALRWPASITDLVPDGRYFLFPAITHPHKNHSVLLDAFSALVRDDPGCDDVHLVLTGREGSAEDEVIRRYFEPGLAGRVVRPGRVPADQLDALFRDAAAVVFPSRYEGFGLPILEAMSRGVPVIASRAGSLPELARAEDLVDPDDVGEWAAAMRTVLTQTPESREARIADGKRVAASFTAERTASGLIGAYRRALAADPDRHDRRTTPRTP